MGLARLLADRARSDRLLNQIVQFVAANLGFMANRPPLVLPGGVRTHTDLRVTFDLNAAAHDREGDAVFFRIVAAGHGTAVLNPDGHTVSFIPAAAYDGPANFQFQAEDGRNDESGRFFISHPP